LLAAPRGLFSLCRSCCHFPSMLPAGFALDDRFWTPAPPFIRLSNEGFSDSTRDRPPAPDAFAFRPRLAPPRNCCARASFFFFSLVCLTKFSKDAEVEATMLGEGANGVSSWWVDVERKRVGADRGTTVERVHEQESRMDESLDHDPLGETKHRREKFPYKSCARCFPSHSNNAPNYW